MGLCAVDINSLEGFFQPAFLCEMMKFVVVWHWHAVTFSWGVTVGC